MWKKKRIETKLNEKRFLERLKTLCREKTRFDKGYNDKDVFVVKRNKNQFWLCKHYAHVGRTDGYAYDCIYFQCIVKENGYVDIEYRFGKRLLFVIPDIIICLMALPLFTCALYDTIFNAYYQWGGLFVTMILSFLGLFNLFSHSKKERNVLEEHLFKICFPNN